MLSTVMTMASHDAVQFADVPIDSVPPVLSTYQHSSTGGRPACPPAATCIVSQISLTSSSPKKHIHTDLKTTAGEVHSIVEDLIESRRHLERGMNLNADRGSAIASSSLDDRSKFDSKYFEMLADPGNQSHNNADNYLDSTAKSLVESHEREEDIEKDTVVSQLREILAFKDKMISRLKQKATDAVESKDTAMENAQLDLSEVQAAHHDVKCELKDTLVKLHSCLQGYQQVKQGLRDQQQTYKSTLEAIHAQVDEREDYYLELERKYEHAARRVNTLEAEVDEQGSTLRQVRQKLAIAEAELQRYKYEADVKVQQETYFQENVTRKYRSEK